MRTGQLIEGVGLIFRRSSWVIFGITLSSIFLFLPVETASHPEYAIQTNQPCEGCHIDPGGGGILNSTGEAFRTRGHRWPIPTARAYIWQRCLQLTVGWLHLAAAVAWLGAILFIHLILSPRTVEGGIPTKEIVYSWACIIILVSTGIYLSIAKLNSLAELTSTTFGEILLVKSSLFLLMLCSASLVTFFINPRLKRYKGGQPLQPVQKIFTLEELETFAGKEGKGIYVAVWGRVYDLSQSRLWKTGAHMQRHEAGKELGEALVQSPHGEKPLEKFPIIGVLTSITGAAPGPGNFPYQKLFLVLAYSNLLLALSIVFCVALWRW